MKQYIPVNKKTDAKYPAISQDEYDKWQSDPFLKARYTFTEVVGQTKTAPDPKEAKETNKIQ